MFRHNKKIFKLYKSKIKTDIWHETISVTAIDVAVTLIVALAVVTNVGKAVASHGTPSEHLWQKNLSEASSSPWTEPGKDKDQ